MKRGQWLGRAVLSASLLMNVPAVMAADAVSPAAELARPVTLRGAFKLSEALKSIADDMGKGVIMGKGVEDGDIVLDIDQVSIARALNRILYPRGYGFKVSGGDLVILASETRIFRLVLPPLEQQLDSLTTNESQTDNSGSGDKRASRVKVGTKVFVENSAPHLSFWEEAEGNIKALLSSSGTVTLNRVGGVVMVTDSPVVLDTVEGLINELNKRVSRQILVDVKVIEVELSREHRLGIDWSALMNGGAIRGLRAATAMTSANFPVGGAFTLTGAANNDGSGVTDNGVRLFLQALDSFGRVEVMSQPRVAMLNNTVANIQVGETRSYVESSNIETTQSGGTIVSGSLGEVHGGVTLQIMGNMVGNEIFLSVTPVVSSVDNIRSVALGGNSRLEAPETSMKSMNTVVRLKERETAVIGGLITSSSEKKHYGVPYLGKVPFLGRLFSYEGVRRSRVELVILISPRSV
jgi:MSHA type pilus biogenesis protein MshL